MGKAQAGTRCAAIVGPQGGGKTTLMEALLAEAGALKAPRGTASGKQLGDSSAEAKDAGMSTEPNFARCTYLDEPWVFIDCPGSVELLQDSLHAMQAADIAIVVTEADPARAHALSLYLKFLEDHNVPHVVFLNKIDEAREQRIRDVLSEFQAVSERPLVLRQVPLRDGGNVVGAVDLVSERAWKFREGQPSELIELPESAREREEEAREALLETLADFDDALMEQLLEDKVPSSETIYEHMARDLAGDLVAPVLLGGAAHSNGIHRLFKLLRHETPGVAQTAERLGVPETDGLAATVIKTLHMPHAGKISLTRVWRGTLKDGSDIEGHRVSGLVALQGQKREPLGEAGPGDLAGLARIDELKTGDTILGSSVSAEPAVSWPEPLPPVYTMAVATGRDQDDVKLSAALARLAEEDPSLKVEFREETRELLLRGQGDVHLRLTLARLKNRFQTEATLVSPQAEYRETIRGQTQHHTRHKKQTGGHGQFADIRVRVEPLPRGEGFRFDQEITGGVVPRQYIPAVENGVREALSTGPLGFPVVDVAVTLYDGQHHSVDSSEFAFKVAGRQAMNEALPECEPVLLEPIYRTTIHVPSDFTAKIHGIVSSQRGQIMGFDTRPGWRGWDQMTAYLPETAFRNLIIELRSASQGVASYTAEFDHYQELYGKDAEAVVSKRGSAA
ncbi:MAG: elongation factor G [Alphaproteobacteria bacterium]